MGVIPDHVWVRLRLRLWELSLVHRKSIAVTMRLCLLTNTHHVNQEGTRHRGTVRKLKDSTWNSLTL